jgi:AraC-like DNA-binding protein
VLDVVFGEGVGGEVGFHAHEMLQVLLPTSPFVVPGSEGRVTLVQPGVVHVTSPLEMCAARGVDGGSFSTRIMLLSPTALTPRQAPGYAPVHRLASATPDVAPSFGERVIEDGALYAELMSVFDALRRPLVELHYESRLRDCLTSLVAGAAAAGATRPVRSSGGVALARDYLRAHSMEPVTLDELANVARLSKFYLLRAFNRAYGLTPHAYQMQLRLARARRLLGEGRPLSHVTYDAGFADQSHLTRRFAAFYGLTPARYARQLTASLSGVTEPPSSLERTVTPPPAA